MDGSPGAIKYPDAKTFAYEDGKRYEEFVSTKAKALWGLTLHFHEGKEAQLLGETMEGLEVKFDGRLKETGNLYIETAEKSRAAKTYYYPSGIFREDNTRAIWIGDYKEAFVISKKVLQDVYVANTNKKVQISTSQGFLLPKEQAKRIAKYYFQF